MKTISVRAPMRADLAGGTLDLWPLYLFYPGSRTVNVAISCFAECHVTHSTGAPIEIQSTDQNSELRFDSAAEAVREPLAAFAGHALEHFKLTGVRIETRSQAPRGSGLGGSSAIGVALVRALSEFAERPIEGEALIALVRDLETRLLRVPAGIQDYYPAVYGGLASINLLAGAPSRVQIRLPVSDLADHLVIHYSGVSHFSGTNNWEIYKKEIDGEKKVREGLSRISRIGIEMEEALEAHDLKRAGAALAAEWKVRKKLVKGISTPEVDASISAAVGAGAWGGKVCGAGGGGCIVFLCPPERRDAVIEALAGTPGNTLPYVPVGVGIEVEAPGDRQTPATIAGERRSREQIESVEQVFVSSEDKAPYQPWALVEAEVVYDLQRAGIRWAEPRCVIAPIDWTEDRVDWSASVSADPSRFRLSPVPDPSREQAAGDDRIAEWARDGEETFRQHLAERERLVLLYNPAFQIYSQPGEAKDSFRRRCQEVVNQALDEEIKRLESVFRRRMDQLKEKQEKEERDKAENEPDWEGPPDEVNIPWGQLLYNITSGKQTPAAAPQSIREIDYLNRIAALQKQWERERESLLDELTDKARLIEELVLEPEERNIGIQRFRVVWASRGEVLERVAG